MKRSISVLLSLLLVLSLTACVSLKTPNAPAARPETGSEAATSASTPAEASASEPEPAEAPAAEPEAAEAPAPEDVPADEPESQEAPAPEDAPADEPGSKDAPVPEDAPADEPGSKDAPAPEDAPADEPGSKDAPAPEDAPADEPADADAPFGEAVKTAAQQLAQAQSMHIDMKLDINPELTVPMGEMEQHVPMDVGMIWRIDYANAPLQIRLDFGLSAVGNELNRLIYVVQDGENTSLYASEDGGATWRRQTGVGETRLPQLPDITLGLLSGSDIVMEPAGTAQVNGKTAAVYAGKVEGRYLPAVLNITGAVEEIAGALGSQWSGTLLATLDSVEDLSDIEVYCMFDQESGLPVRFSMDMTAAMEDLMTAALRQILGAENAENMGVILNLPTALLEITLSQFDGIEPIEIPEAALNAPEM